MNGTTAYCVSDDAVDIINCEDEANPFRVGQYSDLGPCYGIAVSGTMAAVADYDYGLRILDVSNPVGIQLLGELPISGANPYKVVIDGSVAYVALINGGFVIADISDPANPVQKSRLNLRYAYDVKERDNFLYVADGSVGLSIFDVSDSAAPSPVGNYDSNGFVRTVALSGTNAVIGDSTKGLIILDVSDPVHPSRIGIAGLAGTPLRVWVDGTIAYVAEGEDGIEVFDFSDLENITKIATIPAADYARGVVKDGTTLFVADRNAGLSLIDVQDNSVPVILGSYRGFSPGPIFAAGTTAVVASSAGNEVSVTDRRNVEFKSLDSSHVGLISEN